MTLNTAQELEKLQAIGRIVAMVREAMGVAILPGMSTRELDAIGARLLNEAGARSAPQLSYGFPGATCISVNHHVAHGIPDGTRLQSGDLVNIDVSAEKDGFFADTGASFTVGKASQSRARLCQAGKKILQLAIQQVRAGRPLNRLGWSLQREARRRGYTLIQNLGSHGVGRALHEEPSFIAPYPDPNDKRVLAEGMVITLEPFVSTGATEVFQLRDGWTLATEARYDTVQYEHTLVVTRAEPIIVTSLDARASA
ncbi:MAG: type I methionyl aminopeptidase [Candidatus Melainabacteria bacterium HGW-Melainabacteria-1]|nr:MAG: type I methionyl aminopeptidase [Candidatus Melainabacteria bacterium HGW-Melainabacteria-1]